VAKNIIEVLIKGKDEVTAKLKGVSGGIREVGKEIAAVAGVIAAAGAAITGLVMKIARWGDELAKASKKVGVTVEFLSAMDYAAQISGAQLASLTTGLRRLARAASDTTYGLTTYKRAFESLGMTVVDSQGRLKEVEVLFMELVDALQKVESESKKVALAQELLGRGGAELKPLLDQGAAGIHALMEEAKELGIVLSTEEAAQYEEFVDSTTRLKSALKGLGIALTKDLVNPMTELINALAKGEEKKLFEMFRYWLIVALKPGDIRARAGAFKELYEVIYGTTEKKPVVDKGYWDDVAAAEERAAQEMAEYVALWKALEAPIQAINRELDTHLEKVEETFIAVPDLVNPVAEKYEELARIAQEVAWMISSSFGDAFAQMIGRAHQATEIIARMLESLGRRIVATLAERAISYILPFSGGGEIPQAQIGLEAVGGRYGRDTIPALISRGEVVMPSPTVERLNRFLDEASMGTGGSINIFPLFHTGSRSEINETADWVKSRLDKYGRYVFEGEL